MTQKVVAGTVRNTNGSWSVISDAEHSPINIASVSGDPLNLQINFSFKAKQVVTFIITTDETYALAKCHVGASVGLDKAIVYLTENPQPGSNLWIYGIFNC